VRRGESGASVVGEGPPFATLIQAREDQQRRLRARLEQQNIDLQQRLTESDGKVPAKEFITFVTELKDMVNKHHETENSTLRALHEMVCSENGELRAKMELLEARVASSDESRLVLREEQTEQSITLSTMVEALKEDFERLIGLTAEHERKIDANPATSGKLDEMLSEMDERLNRLENVPEEIRQEMVEIEVQMEQQRLEVTEELRLIKEKYPDTEEKLTAVMTKAEENLAILQNHADNAVQTANYQAQHVEELVVTSIAELGNGLKSQLERQVEELSMKVEGELATLNDRTGEADLKLDDSLEKMQNMVEEYIASLEDENGAAIKEALAELKYQAAQQDAERRKEYPTAAPERIALMVKQLEGAYTVLEGVARNAATHTVTLDHPYIKRLETVERNLSKVLEDSDVSLYPKLCFSVDTQTAHIETLEGGTKKYERALEDEARVAASEAAINDVATAVEYAIEKSRMRPNYTSSSDYNNKSAAVPPTSSAVEAEIRKKQQAVEKIQSVLKDIARKFQELSDKEPQGAHLTEEDKRAIDVISRQKSAIYQKERELLEKRNELLRSLKQLNA
jgi:hypothetical protein